MPRWWYILCWSLTGFQLAVLVWQLRLGRQLQRHLRETQPMREKIAANLAKSEALLAHLTSLGFPPGEDREAPTAH